MVAGSQFETTQACNLRLHVSHSSHRTQRQLLVGAEAQWSTPYVVGQLATLILIVTDLSLETVSLRPTAIVDEANVFKSLFKTNRAARSQEPKVLSEQSATYRMAQFSPDCSRTGKRISRECIYGNDPRLRYHIEGNRAPAIFAYMRLPWLTYLWKHSSQDE